MDLLKTIIFEFLLGYILQGFSFTLGIFAFNRVKITMKSYIMVSLVLIIISYFIRLLPISFGVHTILNLLALFLLSIILLKMPIYTTIRSTLFVTVLLLVCEMANVGLMISVVGREEFQQKMLVPTEKAIVGLPGALTFSALIIISYFLLTKNKGNKSGKNGKTSA